MDTVRNIGYFVLGLVASGLVVVAGLALTNVVEHGVFLAISILLLPIAGVYVYKYGKRLLAWGILTCFIPIALLAIIFFIGSSLH